MGAASTSNPKEQAKAPVTAWLFGLAGWFFPGGGHFLQGRWVRGGWICAAILAMIAIGLLMGGKFYSLEPGDGAYGLLQIAPAIANLGSGGLYLICGVADIGFVEKAEQMKRVTYEYGSTFLLVGGLLNYLAMLDAFDIAAGRKG